MRAELQRKKQQATQRSGRVRAKVRGTAERPRLSVFRSNRHYYVQLINDTNANTLASASTADKGVDTVEALGKEIATQATKAGVKKAVFDRGSLAYGGNMAKLADAARAAGLDF